MDGFFWYSKKQQEVGRSLGFTGRNYCNIGGKIHEYTQWMSGKCLRNSSNWDDAIRLGYGFFSYHKQTDEPHPNLNEDREEKGG